MATVHVVHMNITITAKTLTAAISVCNTTVTELPFCEKRNLCIFEIKIIP